MGDEQGSDVQPLLQELELKAHLIPELGVQIAERLIEQQQPRLGDERSGQRDPLLLAAAQQRRGPVLEGGHADQFQCLAHLVSDLGPAELASLQGIRNVLVNCHVGPDRVGLEHHADSPLVRRHRELPVGDDDRLVAEVDLSRIRILETGHHAQGGALPASAGPQERHDLPVVDLEGQVLDRRYRRARIGLPQTLEPHGGLLSRLQIAPVVPHSRHHLDRTPRAVISPGGAVLGRGSHSGLHSSVFGGRYY